MTLQEQIKADIKGAMMAREQVKLDVLRGISTAIVNELVSKSRKPQDSLTDDEVLTVITRLAKQRKDAIEQFTKGGREDLVSEEKAQLEILETFLPTLMSEDEVRTAALQKKEHVGITDQKEKGKLMAELMKDLKGKADGSVVKRVVDSLFV